MNKAKFLMLATAFSAITLTGCFESEAEEQKTAAVASEASSTITGVYCSKTEDRDSALVVIEAPLQNELHFSFSTWDIKTGHNCGTVNAIADATDEPGQWQYTANENGDECTLNFNNADGILITQTAGECRNFCGARAQIGKLAFPASSKSRADATQSDMDNLYEGPDLCQ